MGKQKSPRAPKTKKKIRVLDQVEQACQRLGLSAMAIFRRAHREVHGALDLLRVKKDYRNWMRSRRIVGYVLRYLREPKVPKAERLALAT